MMHLLFIETLFGCCAVKRKEKRGKCWRVVAAGKLATGSNNDSDKQQKLFVMCC